MRRTLNPETKLQISIVGYLRLGLRPGTIFWHTPNGVQGAGEKAARQNARLNLLGQMAGFPDICIASRGVVYGVEVKTPKGRQSDAQKRVELAFSFQGWEYAIVRSLEDVKDCLRRWHIPMRYKQEKRL